MGETIPLSRVAGLWLREEKGPKMMWTKDPPAGNERYLNRVGLGALQGWESEWRAVFCARRAQSSAMGTARSLDVGRELGVTT